MAARMPPVSLRYMEVTSVKRMSFVTFAHSKVRHYLHNYYLSEQGICGRAVNPSPQQLPYK